MQLVILHNDMKPKAGECYWHMKHNKNDFFSYLYIVIGISCDTEDESLQVVYAPLYESEYELYNRELKLFIGSKEVNGVEISRFTKVTNPQDLQTIYDSGRLTKWSSILDR